MLRQGVYVNLQKQGEDGHSVVSARFIPQKYYKGIKSKKETKKQLTSIKKSIESYSKNVYIDRPKLTTYRNKKSNYIIQFNEAYGISITDKKAVAKLTGVTIKAQEHIIKKGKGAYYSSGSRPGQSSSSWAYARLASVIMGGKARKYDQHILDEENIVIKRPRKKVVSKSNKLSRSYFGKKIDKKTKKTKKHQNKIKN